MENARCANTGRVAFDCSPKAMTDYKTTGCESSVTAERTDLQKRDVRALTEYMTVLPLGGDMSSVTTESGSEYRVDPLEGRCTCPDKQYNLSSGELCKHGLRVAYAIGETSIPVWADSDAIDSQLGDHVSGTPKLAATDGGIKTIPTEKSETDSTDKGRERPDDCDCGDWNDGMELPCWPCYRDNWETSNSKGEEEAQ